MSIPRIKILSCIPLFARCVVKTSIRLVACRTHGQVSPQLLIFSLFRHRLLQQTQMPCHCVTLGEIFFTQLWGARLKLYHNVNRYPGSTRQYFMQIMSLLIHTIFSYYEMSLKSSTWCYMSSDHVLHDVKPNSI